MGGEGKRGTILGASSHVNQGYSSRGNAGRLLHSLLLTSPRTFLFY